MTILVTGGSGFIGHHLVKKLKNIGKEVLVLDINEPKQEVDFVKGSVLEKDVLNKIKNQYNITEIYHLASAIGVQYTDKEKLITLNVIIEGTKNLIQFFDDSINFFYFASSSEVYGSTNMATETDDPSPFSTYGVAKIAAEEYVKVICENRGIRYVITRFFNIYGSHQSSSFVVPKFIEKALANDDLKLNNGGIQKRCFTFVDDAIDALIKIFKSNTQGIFNIGNPDNHYSIKELAETILKLTNSKSKIQILPEISHDVLERIPNIAKIKIQLGWIPKVSLEMGLNKMLGSQVILKN